MCFMRCDDLFDFVYWLEGGGFATFICTVASLAIGVSCRSSEKKKNNRFAAF